MSQKAELTDHEVLDAAEHFQYRACVGKLLHLSAHRVDTQHGLGVLSTALSAPTKGDQRRLKKMARFLAGTRDVLLQLIPDRNANVIDCFVDADWADKQSDRRSTSGGVLQY